MTQITILFLFWIMKVSTKVVWYFMQGSENNASVWNFQSDITQQCLLPSYHQLSERHMNEKMLGAMVHLKIPNWYTLLGDK